MPDLRTGRSLVSLAVAIWLVMKAITTWSSYPVLLVRHKAGRTLVAER